MISKDRILFAAAEKLIRADMVEKDHALGWLLMGIARHPLLGLWVFKGGTCLKKCFFETYRFSEDLDFTVPSGMIYEADAYRAALVECTRRIEAESGVRFPADGIEIKESCDKAGRVTFSAKISYRGPLMMKTGTPPRIKIDLTQHELIVDDPDSRPIRHFYPDALKPAVAIRCYSANEILAEKTRALFERQDRARDLYDVVNILRCYREHIDA